VDLSDPNDFIDADDKVHSLVVGGVIGAGALFTFFLFVEFYTATSPVTNFGIKVNKNFLSFIRMIPL
jgi:hypothetical protein